MFLTVDGGGSKLTCLLFDENLRTLGFGRSGGVNATQNDQPSILTHVRECLDQVLAGLPSPVIEEAFIVFVGDRSLFERELKARAKVEKITFFDEARGGLLAGSGREEGLLAISGTGSDVFYITEGRRSIVGGWGIVLGDQGSGSWIGWKAIRTVIRTIDGWHSHENDRLTRKVLRYFDAEDEPRRIVSAVHSAPAPFPVIARLVPLVAEAADEGDPFALSLFEDAGRVLGRQMNQLLAREKLRNADFEQTEITLCGGAWKAHPAMFEAFCRTVKDAYPEMQVHRPWFEHVLAGPMKLLLDRGFSREESRALLVKAFPDHTIEKEGLSE